jgi:tetratricopeptide (TPR) repeat protein
MSHTLNLQTALRKAKLGLAIVAGTLWLLSACAPSQRPKLNVLPPDDKAKKAEIRLEQRAFIAHEFFLRARQQEMEGNDAVALSYFQIAYEYDTQSRDLCFLLTDKFKAAGKMDSALATGLRCLELKGLSSSHEYQVVAEIHLRKGDIQNALLYYNKALGLDDQDKDLLYTLATLYESLKDIPKHLFIMDKLLPKVDYPVRMVEKQSQNYRALGKLDSVAKLYRVAWDKTGNSLFGEKLASFYEDQELYANLLDVLRKLVAENSENLQYELQKARALILANQTDSAMLAYESLLKKSPEEREYISPYATLLFEKGRFPESKVLFQKLVKGQPDNPIYHFFLGSIGMELKDTVMAESELKNAIDLDAKVPEYWAKLATFYIVQGEEQKALDLLEKMGEGKDWYACYIQGIVFTQVAKKLEVERKNEGAKIEGAKLEDSAQISRSLHYREQGVVYFQKALDLEGNNRRVLFELGVALEQLHRRSESIGVMKRLVKLDSSDGTILNYLGYMLVEEEKDLDYAGTLIERALRLEPGNGAFLDSKGWLYYKKKDYPGARKYIQMALDHIPEDTTILEHLALILEKLGMGDAAMEKWRMILKLDPRHELAHRKLN